MPDVVFRQITMQQQRLPDGTLRLVVLGRWPSHVRAALSFLSGSYVTVEEDGCVKITVDNGWARYRPMKSQPSDASYMQLERVAYENRGEQR